MSLKRRGYGIDLLIQASKFLESSDPVNPEPSGIGSNHQVTYNVPLSQEGICNDDDTDIYDIKPHHVKYRYPKEHGANFLKLSKETVVFEEQMDHLDMLDSDFIQSPPLYKEYNAPQMSQPSSFLKFRSQLDVHSSIQSHSIGVPNIRGSREPRCTHNELEKNRRAHLRRRMEILRDHLPMDSETVSRLTMLTVLTKANLFMKDLERNNKNLVAQKISMQAKHEQLLQKRDAIKKKQHRLAMKYGIRNLSAVAPSSRKSFVSWRVRNQSNVSNTSSSSTGSEEDSEIENYLLNSQSVSIDSQEHRDSGYDSPSLEYNSFELLSRTSRMTVATEAS